MGINYTRAKVFSVCSLNSRSLNVDALVSSFVGFVFLWRVLNHRNMWLSLILVFAISCLLCRNVLFLPTASYPRNMRDRGKPVVSHEPQWQRFLDWGLLDLLGVAPGFVFWSPSAHTYCSRSKWRTEHLSLHFLPPVSQVFSPRELRSPLLCVSFLRASNTTNLSQRSFLDMLFFFFSRRYIFIPLSCVSMCYVASVVSHSVRPYGL